MIKKSSEIQKAFKVLDLVDMEQLLSNAKIVEYAKRKIDEVIEREIKSRLADKELKSAISKAMTELIKTEDVKDKIKIKVIESVDAMVLQVPTIVKNAIVSEIWNAVKEGIASRAHSCDYNQDDYR